MINSQHYQFFNIVFCGEVWDNEKEFKYPERWLPAYVCRQDGTLGSRRLKELIYESLEISNDQNYGK